MLCLESLLSDPSLSLTERMESVIQKTVRACMAPLPESLYPTRGVYVMYMLYVNKKKGNCLKGYRIIDDVVVRVL